MRTLKTLIKPHIRKFEGVWLVTYSPTQCSKSDQYNLKYGLAIKFSDKLNESKK